MAFKTSEKYKSVIYSGDCRHKLKLLFNGVELADADVYCESLKVTSRILPNGSTRFSLDNFIAKEAEIILHDIDTTKIQSPVNISIGTLVDGTYEYVPIGLFVVQDLPTTDKNKTTIKLRDYAVKFDFGYNAKDIIDENGGSVTKLQILQDICNKAGVETDITKFYGSNSKIGIYDNSITARTYISYLAEQAGAIATIDRSGKLIFVQLKDLETVEIPLNIVEKYEDGEKYEISRVVYEDAIRKFEYGDESKDTLFINTANPYIDNEVLTNTLTGTQIETSDSADAEVVNYKQYGITKQETTEGKNLIGTNYITGVTLNDATTNDITIRNNWASTIVSNENLLKVLKPSTTYTISYKYKVLERPSEFGRYNTVYILGLYDGGSGFTNFGETQKNTIALNTWDTITKTFTTPASLTNYKMIAYDFKDANNTTTGTIEVSELQIEEGSTATEYEPHTGNQPSPNPDYPQEIKVATGSVSVKSTTKNLLINSSFRENLNYWTTHSGVEIGEKLGKKCLHIPCNLTTTRTAVQNIAEQVKPGKIYTISCYAYAENIVAGNTNFSLFLYFDGRTTEGNWCGTQRVNGQNTFLSYNYSNGFAKVVYTFKVPENVDLNRQYGCYVYSRDCTGDLYVYDLQLEEGKVDTDYQEHQHSSITYDLGDNFLADKDYIENGVLHKNIGKVVLNGSESGWKPFLDSNGHYNYYINNPLIAKNVDKCWCNQFIYQGVRGDNMAGEFSIGGYNPNKNGNIVFNPSNDTTNKLSNFLTKIASNPLEVYFPLETPEQIQLTSTGELRTFEPNTIITNSLDSEMEVEYARNQTQVSQILELNKDIPLNSFKTGKIIGNPAIDAYDIIKIVDGNKEFKTLATNDLTYNGVMINTFDTQIGKEAKKENVTLTPEATFKKWAKTEIDNVEAEVRINTGNIQTVKDEIGNMYTKGQVNELVANAETGVTNTFSEAGGNNILRNTGLWFESNDTDNPYEFWAGNVKKGKNDNAVGYNSMLLQNGTLEQEQEVPNGDYSISFYYQKLNQLCNASVVINDVEYPLESMGVKQFYTGEKDNETGEYIVQPIVVSSNHINIKFKCDVDNGVEVYDLMCNKGSVKLAYSQNQNETTTDTVNISKGITITSSNDENVKFKADYDGIRILDGANNPKTKFTDKGMETDEAIIRYKEQTCGTLIQEVGDQTWFTRM